MHVHVHVHDLLLNTPADPPREARSHLATETAIVADRRQKTLTLSNDKFSR